MKTIKNILLGVCGGVIYAIVNFILFTPYFKGNIIALCFWGAQAGILIALMSLFSFLLPKYQEKYVSCTAISGLCGFIASLPHVLISWFGRALSLQENNALASDEITKAVQYDLASFSLGWIVLGVTVGILIKKISYR